MMQAIPWFPYSPHLLEQPSIFKKHIDPRSEKGPTMLMHLKKSQES